MATNPYFKHIDAENERELYHDLATEMVQMAGVNVYYVKATGLSGEFDDLFGENRFQTLSEATEIEMLLENMEIPYGGGDIYTKFGLSMNQTATFVVAYKRFEEVFGGRPKEGDYIYIPMWNARTPADIFRINYVDVDKYQYEPLGNPLYYQLSTERAKFSHETVNTGLDELDVFGADLLNNDSVAKDFGANNDTIESLGDIFQQFDEQHPFGTA